MRPDSTLWSRSSVADGPTLCSFQGSLLDETTQFRLPAPPPDNRRTLPILPVSPIKKTDVTADASQWQSQQAKSLRRGAEARRVVRQEDNTSSIMYMSPTPQQQQQPYQHSGSSRQLQMSRSTSQSEEEEVQGREMYERALKLRQLIQEGQKSQKQRRPRFECSTFRAPSRSYVLPEPCSEPTMIEAPRHRTATPPTSAPASRQPSAELINQLLERNLKAFKDVAVGGDATVVGGRQEEEEGRRTGAWWRDQQECPSIPRRGAAGPPPAAGAAEEEEEEAPPRRPEVRQYIRELFDDVCNVDTLPHKGNLQEHRRQLDSSSMRRLLGQPAPPPPPRRSASSAQPRRVVDSRPSSKSPQKPPPFYSSVNKDSYSQCIYANEQELLRLVNIYFRQWRTFVHQLIQDETVGEDVAVRFLEEIESRRKAKELGLRFQSSEDQQVHEFNRKDEKIANKLRDHLHRGQPSRIRQLRIMHQVLRESC